MTSRKTAAEVRRERLENWRENGRRAAECAGVGLLVTAFSLPVVTAGAAWIAAAGVFDAWTQDEEPPQLRTFADTVRRRWRVGLALEGVFAAIVAIGYFDIRFAWAAQVPGAHAEVVALAVLCAAAAALLLLTVVRVARTGGSLRSAFGEARAVAAAAPWTIAALALACAVCVVLVMIVPAFVLVLGGPLAFAAAAVHARATLSR